MSSTYIPAWNPDTIYATPGTEVTDEGAIFENKWYTQGDDPLGAYPPYSDPWELAPGSPAPNPNPAKPSAPTGVTSAFTASDRVALTWNPATVPGIGVVTSYDIYENGIKIGTSTSNYFTASGLTPATSYKFTVDAVDATGTSGKSAAYAVTTSAPVISSGKIFSPYVDMGLQVDENLLAISQTTKQLDYTLAFIQSSGVDTFKASISGDVLTVTSVTSGTLLTDGALVGAGVTPGTEILSQLSGATGGVGTYQLSNSQTVASRAMSEVTIGWAGTGTIDNDGFPDNASLPDIQQIVQTLQSEGGTITISLGGSSGTDPAVEADNLLQAATAAKVAAKQLSLEPPNPTQAQIAQALTEARADIDPAYYPTYAKILQGEYQSIINRYGVTHLDFDIEGGAVANQESISIRDLALVGLEAANPGLQVSFTLPVLPTGLDSNGVNVVDNAVKAGVKVDVVNIMAMDYGATAEEAGDVDGGVMAKDAIDAATNTEAQLQAAGLDAKVGITPMLGVNDDAKEVFTIADAQQVEAFAAQTPWVASLGFWSLARDNNDAGQASLTDSGTPQTDWEFSSIFAPIAVVTQAKPDDFNGDGASDLLFRNPTTGGYLDWSIFNGAKSAAHAVASSGVGWSYVGTGDFNHDGTVDLLIENTTTGQLRDWDLSKGSYAGAHVLGTLSPSSGVTVVGTGDFNADGTTDLLLQNANTRALTDWLMSDNAHVSSNALGAPAAGYSVIGVGDFNGDGVSDILLQNSTTHVLQDWQMSNDGKLGEKTSLGAPTSGWTYVDSGDLLGNGTSDILFESSTNQLEAWIMNGGKHTQTLDLGIAPPGSSMFEIGDFGAAGSPGVVSYNTSSGQAELGLVANEQITTWKSLGLSGTNWHLVA